jgi:hypothetical protein
MAAQVEEEDPSALPSSAAANIVRTRTYDVSLTYDKYYQCARVWLYGYSEARLPLTSDQVLEKLTLANPSLHLRLHLRLRLRLRLRLHLPLLLRLHLRLHLRLRLRLHLRLHLHLREPATQVLEDISSDHALKTVTLEAHPHTSHGAGLHA